MEYLLQIGNSTDDLIEDIKEMELVADYKDIKDDGEADNSKRKLEELQNLEKFDFQQNLDHAEQLLFKSQYFSLFQLKSSGSESSNEEHSIANNFHVYKMSNPLKPFRVIERKDNDAISRVMKTTDVTFTEFTESTRYPNLFMYGGAEFLVDPEITT